jgi:hypothetical protein
LGAGATDEPVVELGGDVRDGGDAGGETTDDAAEADDTGAPKAEPATWPCRPQADIVRASVPATPRAAHWYATCRLSTPLTLPHSGRD